MSNLFGEDYEGRKAVPIFEGNLMYFPKAHAAVAAVSDAGNKQHNPGESLHWARGKSMDQYNTALRHMMDHRMGGGRLDPQQEGQSINNGWRMERYDKDGVRHLAKAAWRILAALELDMEEEEREKTRCGTAPQVDMSRDPECHCKQFCFIDHTQWQPGYRSADGIVHTAEECV